MLLGKVPSEQRWQHVYSWLGGQLMRCAILGRCSVVGRLGAGWLACRVHTLYR